MTEKVNITKDWGAIATITVGQLVELVNKFSEKFSSIENNELTKSLADLFEVNVQIPLDNLRIFASFI